MPDPDTSLELLIEGNKRFLTGQPSIRTDAASLLEHVQGQSPFAVVIGCSDSRVPVEIVFDRGIGELFVIRIAGNVVAPTQIGSVEFAATRFGTRLVMVLGHTGCGAVSAALEAFDSPDEEVTPGLLAVVDRIKPALTGLNEAKDRLRAAVEANVRASVRELVSGSEILTGSAARGQVEIVGAVYDLPTGEVEILERFKPGSAR